MRHFCTPMTAHPTGTDVAGMMTGALAHGDSRHVWVRAAPFAIGGLSCLYLIQAVTPIRLDTDGVAYLHSALQLADRGAAAHGVPIGYPAIVAALIRLGVANAPVLVLLNFVFLAIGFASFWWIARETDPVIRQWTIALSLLSFPIIKVGVTPNTDAAGFGLMLAAVALASSMTPRRTFTNLALLLGVAMLTVATTAVRLAGLVLVVVLIWCVYEIVVPRPTALALRVAISVGVMAMVIAGAVLTVGLTEDGTLERYADEVGRQLRRPPLDHLVFRASIILRGLGELTTNLPLSPFRPLRPWLWTLGVVPAIFLAVRSKRLQWSRPVTVFVAAYFIVLAVWPFHATRLWVPLIPLLLHMAVSFAFQPPRHRYQRAILALLASAYVLGGAAALAHTTSVTFAGDNFRWRWGANGGFAHPGHEGSNHNERALEIVRRLDSGNPAWNWLDSMTVEAIREHRRIPGTRAPHPFSRPRKVVD